MKQFGKKMIDTAKGAKMILIPVVAVTAVAVGYSYFSADPPAVNNSSVTTGPMAQQTTLQGGTPLSESYKEELGRADEQRIQAAREKGGSAIPTIRPGSQEQLSPIPVLDPVKEETPVVETPKVETAPIVLNTPPPAPMPSIVTPAPAVVSGPSGADVDSLKTYMAGLRRAPGPAEVLTFGSTDLLKKDEQLQNAPLGVASADAAKSESKVQLPLAGKILYAQLVSRADSDAPGPVLAKIVQGEYAGATLIGSFQKAENALVISFDRMTVEKSRDGEEINETVPIKAVAVSTDYIGTALATDVDRHMFQKIAIGFLSGFAQGFGEAISQNGQTTVNTTNGSFTTQTGDLSTKEELLAASGSAVSSTGSILMDEFGRRPTTVRVESGTPIGVLFL